jgi:serine/threonine protein kinase
VDLKIVDFGVFGSNRGNVGEKSNAGSLKYMPPEVLQGFNEATPKIDIWSLGIILHGLVLGYLPFSSSNKEELRKMIIEKEVTIPPSEKLSEHCKDLILKMLDKDPNKRVNLSQVSEHPWI